MISTEKELIKQVDFFRKENNKIFFEVTYEQRKLKRQYLYERGTEEYDDIIIVKIGCENHIGVGECSPFPSFFGYPVEKVLSDLENAADFIFSDLDFNLNNLNISGPAHSGIDLALIDLKCHQTGQTIYQLYGLEPPNSIMISHTVEYESIDKLQGRLEEMGSLPLLKVKLGSDGLDEERLILTRRFAPHSKIIVDVNEGWTLHHLKKIMPLLLKFDVQMIEQPLRHGEDLGLAEYQSPIPIYADESFMDISDLSKLGKCYAGFNIKLDKIGGLTNALKVIRQCKKMNKGIMVGCLGGTSLGL